MGFGVLRGAVRGGTDSWYESQGFDSGEGK